jgi:hypothetical protein
VGRIVPPSVESRSGFARLSSTYRRITESRNATAGPTSRIWEGIVAKMIVLGAGAVGVAAAHYPNLRISLNRILLDQ